MAALGFIIILLGLLASLKPRGWRVAAWIAGFLPIFIGLASIVLPDAESSLGLGWSFAAVVWGIVFVAASELTKNEHTQHKEF
jgi:1,4-dihydroxy-2-naphthoate octaprenyltransferase